MCSVGAENAPISIYAKDMGNKLTFVVRSPYPIKEPRKNNKEYGVMFLEFDDYTSKNYAEIALQRMNGEYKIVYGKNSTKIELSIPTNLKLDIRVMREEEVIIRCGEPVMPYAPCGEKVLKEMFPVFLKIESEE